MDDEKFAETEPPEEIANEKSAEDMMDAADWQFPPFSVEWFNETGKRFVKFDEIAKVDYPSFQSKYSKDWLQGLSDDELLDKIFWMSDSESLCHTFIYQEDNYGGAGGSFGKSWYLKKEKNGDKWQIPNGHGFKTISDNDALDIGKNVRRSLIDGLDIIKTWGEEAEAKGSLTVDDYKNLRDALHACASSQNLGGFWEKGWVLKYCHMFFPNYFTNFYTVEFVDSVLYYLGIKSDEDIIVKIGEINCFRMRCGISNVVFSQICYAVMYSSPFFNVCINDRNLFYEEWYKENRVGVGYKYIKDFNAIAAEANGSGRGVKSYVTNLLKTHVEKDQRNSVLADFEKLFEPTLIESGKYFIVTCQKKILAIGVSKGEYEFSDDEYGNYCNVRWLKKFRGGIMLPSESDLYDNAHNFYKFWCNENIIFLYNLIFELKNDVAESRGGPGIGKPGGEKIYVNKTDFSYNRIVFGAPGAGKSFSVEAQRKKLLGDDSETDYERVTFFPDYSYANFVGTYKPVPKSEDGKEVVTYEYVPGPFMRIYVEASKHPEKPYLLVIEEINRANAAAVFGDVFQLLDRVGDKEDEHFGESMYPIQASEDMKKYLAEKLGGSPDDYLKIKIPGNMFIWATMNSADQGVYPLDTAFKRRWDFEYIGIDNGEENLKGKTVMLGKDGKQIVEWNALRKAINDCLASNKINEDKQLGAYFINPEIVEADAEKTRSEKFIATFKDKVLMYLFEDAGRQIRSKLFGERSRYSEICKKFDEDGVNVFCKEISDYKGVIIKNSQVGQENGKSDEGNN